MINSTDETTTESTEAAATEAAAAAAPAEPAENAEAKKAPEPVRKSCSPGLTAWMRRNQVSIAFTSYQSGRLYLLGTGTSKDSVQAARWLRLAANKGQRSAQAMLGSMLFKGQGVARQPAAGLAWLTLAKDGASAQEAKDVVSHHSITPTGVLWCFGPSLSHSLRYGLSSLAATAAANCQNVS